MKPPPDQVAATVEMSLNRSRTAMTLVPAVPGLHWVAYHEIRVWVTSCGWRRGQVARSQCTRPRPPGSRGELPRSSRQIETNIGMGALRAPPRGASRPEYPLAV